METENINERNQSAASELRADAYANALTVEFPANSGELITYDKAAQFYNSYSAVDDTETAAYLKQAIKDAKAYIKSLFPDEETE